MKIEPLYMPDGSLHRMLTAKAAVVEYLNTDYAEANGEDEEYTTGDLFIVWFCKTLRNWKALIGTDVIDDVYFEVTFDGNKDRIYLDHYEKVSNNVVELEEED